MARIAERLMQDEHKKSAKVPSTGPEKKAETSKKNFESTNVENKVIRQENAQRQMMVTNLRASEGLRHMVSVRYTQAGPDKT